MTGTITNLMIDQHNIINKKLIEFIKTPKNNIEKLKKNFLEFRWNNQKHMFNEETNIWQVIDHKDKDQVNEIKYLLNDHREIAEQVEKILDFLILKKKLDAEELLKKISIHEQRETGWLYPLLDQKLSLRQKKEILAYSNEIKIV